MIFQESLPHSGLRFIRKRSNKLSSDHISDTFRDKYTDSDIAIKMTSIRIITLSEKSAFLGRILVKLYLYLRSKD